MKVGVVSRLEAAGEGCDRPRRSRFLHAGGGQRRWCVPRHAPSQAAISALEAQGAAVVVVGRRARRSRRPALAGPRRAGRRTLDGRGRQHARGGAAGRRARRRAAAGRGAPALRWRDRAPTPVGGARLAACDRPVALQLVETSTSADDEVILRYRVGGAAAPMTEATAIVDALPATPETRPDRRRGGRAPRAGAGQQRPARRRRGPTGPSSARTSSPSSTTSSSCWVCAAGHRGPPLRRLRLARGHRHQHRGRHLPGGPGQAGARRDRPADPTHGHRRARRRDRARCDPRSSSWATSSRSRPATRSWSTAS